MQTVSYPGNTVVQGGREKFIEEQLKGKTKKAASFCVFLAYRLDKVGDRKEDHEVAGDIDKDDDRDSSEKEIDVEGEDDKDVTKSDVSDGKKVPNLLVWVEKLQQVDDNKY